MDKIAFVFAGQGAQTVGMGRDLYESSVAARKVFDIGFSTAPKLREICFEGSAEALNQTVNTQPCLLLTDLACAMALTERGIQAGGAAGFSLGEVAAVCFAGILPVERAFAFTQKRAEGMQACTKRHPGAMFAVLRLDTSDVETLCADLNEAYPVNYNCPGQTVVACAVETAEALQQVVTKLGGRAVRLNVGGAFHSPFMDEASRALSEYLQSEPVRETRIPVYANLTGELYGDEKYLLSRQVNHPVRWQKTIENMIADGFDTFIECGSGTVLSGLIGKISKTVRVFHVSDVQSLEETAKGVLGC